MNNYPQYSVKTLPAQAPCTRNPRLYDPLGNQEGPKKFKKRFCLAEAMCGTCPLITQCARIMEHEHLEGIGAGQYYGILPRRIRVYGDIPVHQPKPVAPRPTIEIERALPTRPTSGPVTWENITGYARVFDTVIAVLGSQRHRYDVRTLTEAWRTSIDDALPWTRLGHTKTNKTAFLDTEPRHVPRLVAATDYRTLVEIARCYPSRSAQ